MKFVILFTRKWRATHILENHINKPASNKRTFTVGPFFSGKIYLSMKNLENVTPRELLIIPRSPQQYEALAKPNVCYANDFKIKIALAFDEYKCRIAVFDDMLD